MKNNRRWFTLVEMIVWITLSLILMVSVSVFVSWGLTNIFTQKKILETQWSELSFLKNITEQAQAIDSKNIFLYGSWVLFHTTESLGNSHWMLLHQVLKNAFLCSTWTTQHMVLSQMYPFEWEWSNWGSWISFDSSGAQIFPYENKIIYNSQLLTGSFLSPISAVLTGTILYVSDAMTHGIYRFDTSFPLIPWVKIVGETSFWDKVESSWDPLRSFLNFPTWLAWGENSLFIADTNNNRILRLDNSNKLEEFLDASDGLNEPTGLLYDNVRKSLFIVNSWGGEVLEYTSFSWGGVPNLNLTFSPKTLTWITQMRVEFLTTWSGIITTPSFSGITTTEDYQTGSTDIFDYYISDFSQTELSFLNITMTWCTAGTKKYLEGNIPKKEVVTCSATNTGSLEKYYGNNSVDFLSWVDYWLSLQNIIGNFGENRNYAVKLSLFSSGGVEKRQNYYPFFTKSDNQIITKNDNRLRKMKQWMKYPTWIYKSGGNFFVYDFFTRKRTEMDINGTDISSLDETSFDFQNKTEAWGDKILPLPISSFQSSLIGNMLNLEIKYFKNFSCFDQSKLLRKTFFMKKFIEN